jgi:hypothetical protein
MGWQADQADRPLRPDRNQRLNWRRPADHSRAVADHSSLSKGSAYEA